jgi:hypothetical protein
MGTNVLDSIILGDLTITNQWGFNSETWVIVAGDIANVASINPCFVGKKRELTAFEHSIVD